MKTLLLVGLLSTVSLADNCYLFDRGSADWANCKEQAGQMEDQRKQNDANLQEIQRESAAAAIADSQTEQLNQAAREALIEQAREQSQGN